jgi:hypothetical protein
VPELLVPGAPIESLAPELDVPVLLVPAEPAELPEVSVLVLLEPVPIEPDALEPWLAPLDDPNELLPELDPERLVPADPDELGG